MRKPLSKDERMLAGEIGDMFAVVALVADVCRFGDVYVEGKVEELERMEEGIWSMFRSHGD